MLLNNYLNIQNYGSKEFEYKITFKDEAKFYQDVKNEEQLDWWFGDGINECNIELANIVAGFIRPHLPPYTSLVLQTIYLKYQRQERPTIDCRASLLESYVKQFDYDLIEVPYLHGGKETDKIKLNFLKQDIQTEIVILPDEGAKECLASFNLILTSEYDKEKREIVICKKERTTSGISTMMPAIEAGIYHFAIIDDIIAGGDSIINVIKLLKEQRPEAKITVHCIFLMSQYGYDNIKKQCGEEIEIKPIFDLRNKIDNPF